MALSFSFLEFSEENRLDPAYKVFFILMQPLASLKRYTVYMHRYLRTRTYLEHTDPNLWEKLSQYMNDLRSETHDDILTVTAGESSANTLLEDIKPAVASSENSSKGVKVS